MRRIVRSGAGSGTAARIRTSDAFIEAALATAQGKPPASRELSIAGDLERAAGEYVDALARGGIGNARPEPPTLRPFPSLCAFVCSALRCATGTTDVDVVELLASPYSGFARDDARALDAATRARESPREALAADRIPLDAAGRAAAARFTRVLNSGASVWQAQGAGARELLETILLGFELDAGANRHEQATLIELRTCADAVDRARRCTGEPWQTAEVVALVDDALAVAGTAPSGRSTRGLERRTHETPRTLPKRHGHFSASALNAFAECPRKWYYRYVCAAVEDRGSAASFYGSAFHAALEGFHREFSRPDSETPEELTRRLDAFVIAAFERYRARLGWPVEFELQLRRARRTARRYVEWFVARGRLRPFAVAGVELPAELDLEGFSFVGFIDRLDRDDTNGNATVLDYKTGTIARSAAEYRKKIAALEEFQLPYYYWARTLAGDRVTRLTLVPLKDPLATVRPIELEVVPVSAPANGRDESPVGTIGIDELERARKRMVEIARTLSDDRPFTFAVAKDPEACTFCAYRIACRARPQPAEDRFAR